MPNFDRGGRVIDLTRKRRQINRNPKSDRQSSSATRIISITSGKGGVGKTNIVANLGYSLRKAGNRVLIFDADLGLGNVDVLLGLTPKYNLSHVIQGQKSLSDVIVTGPGEIDILPAASGVEEMTKLSLDQQRDVFDKLGLLVADYDIVLFDTAAGISANVLTFNASANEILVVITPEPTAITDAYALIKVLSVSYQEKHFRLIVNLASSYREADEVSRQLCLVADRFLDVSIDYFGSILMDETVKRSVRKQKMVCQMAPMTSASRNFAELAHRLMRSTPLVPGPCKLSLIGRDR